MEEMVGHAELRLIRGKQESPKKTRVSRADPSAAARPMVSDKDSVEMYFIFLLLFSGKKLDCFYFSIFL